MTKNANITVYGAHWCPDCRRSKQFLGEHQIPYRWIDIEQDTQAEEYVLEKNEGKRIIPTVEFADSSILVEPSNAELAAKMGLKTTAAHSHYELIIVGGGPAGLTAALYTAREGIDTLVIERAAMGGQAAATQWLDNVPGFADGIEGAAFADQMFRQAQRFGVEFLQAQDVVNIVSQDRYHRVFTTAGSEYSARTLLIATGSTYRRLEAPGEEDFIGAGIHFCATCDGPFYKGQHVAVIGGGNSAGVFIFIGLTPNTSYLADTSVTMDQWGFVITGHNLLHYGDRPAAFETRAPFPLETSIPGIFAAGDVRAGSTKQVASAAGEGATAALLVREYLQCSFCQRD